MPRSFSEDGAFGAGQPAGVPAAPGTPATTTEGGWSGQLGSSSYGTDPGNTAAYEQASKQTPSSSVGGGFSMNPANLGAYRQAYSAAGISFEDGGAVPDDGGGDTNGSPQQDAIQKALSTVDGVLAYGRKLHGLGGGDNEGGGIQTADAGYQNGRMPARPGNPSESGVAPMQPSPGPLPPTSNPFGKRADAMPARPGTPSDSGVPPMQPSPGPLPPTDNPFGKRQSRPLADNGDSQQAIDTEETA